MYFSVRILVAYVTSGKSYVWLWQPSPLWRAVRAVKAVKAAELYSSSGKRRKLARRAITRLCEPFDGLPELPELLRVGVAVVALAFPSLSLHIAREW
jgi:hypothetical protein